jgi:predicted nucleic acid-binding protein
MRKACVLRDSYSFGFWDSQLVACAILGGCEVLESEDMQDGLIVDGSLVIRNILK